MKNKKVKVIFPALSHQHHNFKKQRTVAKQNAVTSKPPPVATTLLQCAVLHAVNFYTGSTAKWQALAACGATNLQIRETFEINMPSMGGGNIKFDGQHAWVRATRKPPRVWVSTTSVLPDIDKTPTIAGLDLIKMVRELYEIGAPPSLDIPF